MSRAESLLHRLLRRLFPSLTMTRPEALTAIKELQRKLNEERERSKEWRARATSAEHVIVYRIPQALRGAVKEHDAKHETNLGWRI